MSKTRVSRQNSSFLKLELQVVATDVEKNPRETQVFKTQVPPFTFPTPVLLLFSLFSPPTRDSSSFPILLSSIPCFFFFFPYSTSSDLRSPQRSSDLVLFPSFLVLQLHRHLRSSSVELESLRLKFHVTKTSPCQQSKLKSLWLNFFAELEPLRLEMLISSILSNSC